MAKATKPWYGLLQPPFELAAPGRGQAGNQTIQARSLDQESYDSCDADLLDDPVNARLLDKPVKPHRFNDPVQP